MVGLLEVGSKAPDFVLPNQLGRMVQLSDLRGRAPVLLVFYPSDRSRLCTRLLGGLRDAFPELRSHGAQVFGICVDPIASHRELALRLRLPFGLLSDLEHEVRGWFGIGRRFFVLPPRVSFLVDIGGVVRTRCRAQFQVDRHVELALAGLRELVQNPPPWPPDVAQPLAGL